MPVLSISDLVRVRRRVGKLGGAIKGGPLERAAKLEEPPAVAAMLRKLRHFRSLIAVAVAELATSGRASCIFSFPLDE